MRVPGMGMLLMFAFHLFIEILSASTPIFHPVMQISLFLFAIRAILAFGVHTFGFELVPLIHQFFMLNAQPFAFLT